MLHTVGIRHSVKTVTTLVLRRDPQAAVRDTASLTSAYHDFLAAYHPATRYALDRVDDVPAVTTAPDVAQALLAAFADDSPLDDVDYQVIDSSATPMGAAGAEAEQFATTLRGLLATGPAASRDFMFALGLHLPVLLVADSGRLVGGTASNIPGVLWCNTRPSWAERDLTEFLMHELTHTQLYAEEMRHGFYTDITRLMDEENLVQSVIRRDQRPLDKVLHSVFVALEVVQLRRAIGESGEESRVHPSSQVLMRGLADTLSALRTIDLQALCQPHALWLIDVAEAKVHELAGSRSDAVAVA